jgi:hypothetical protein
VSAVGFIPFVNRVNVSGDVVLLEKFQMGMFCQILSAEVDGKATRDLHRFEYQPAETFHRTMSEKFAELAEVHEEFPPLKAPLVWPHLLKA